MLKAWIVKTFFQSYLDAVLAEAARQGSMDAFEKAHADLMETRKDDIEERAKELVEERIAALLSPVDPKHIATYNEKTKQYYIGGELADDALLANLKQEADFLKETNLWKVLHETPKELAQKAMFVAGDSLDDMKKGRSMLYTLDTQKKIVDMFSGYQQR